ncbi:MULTISPECIES: flagellar hook assembly protein FlgD [unclassified Pseudomonas]|uniref:flagellar hook assembly protein FlgD n=1 Tax=unclassified Pseudomonas TaxID=196821 RepID=UPI000BC9D2FA|nr:MULTISPECIES: flagellar hook assembly protein FlgD [unclassified Pseudomonas]PVZ13747.1 flagellar basal-body rod modification protein FlgD [Pseudomonas sp. URIL14HWK12:I12]PVZ24053.1 flagellar basal-body rod modification protein FlgD [Pseudomonas sp. URIL14HWK12:I10]PVZ33308.1 flagellar basal-body rod modification protein FlgD [Pseudomonas sp. URIL14HWK12:I11]SNZ11098.1 flagellar basal-body rod modification protein FlgD [Pseudomonas sp. URIL14HWK12:I9]
MTTTTDSTSSSILSDYALPSSKSSAAGTTSSTDTSKNALGKDAFLKLLVTQMKNQNPLDPQDNSEFVAQLAQFSSVESLSNLNETVSGLASNYTSSQALQASSLVGHSVISKASSTLVNTANGMTGQVALTGATTDLSVNIYDASGNVVKNIDLGKQSAGDIGFSWDGTDNEGNPLPSGTYKFSASATQDGKGVAMDTYLPSTVVSVTVGSTAGDMTLKLADGSSIALSQVKTVGL